MGMYSRRRKIVFKLKSCHFLRESFRTQNEGYIYKRMRNI